MSQAYDNRKPRKSARQRNRPTLVVPGTSEQSEQVLTQESPEPVEVPTRNTEPIAATPTPKRRLPGFFSTIGKKDEEKTAQAEEIARARLARAVRTKETPSSPKKNESTTEKEVTSKETVTSSKPAPVRPSSGFKTRYIIGMALYLILSNFIGLFEAGFLRNTLHYDPLLIPPFNLFGGQIRIYLSTVTFLLTLIIILVVLARLDLIPRSLSGTSNTRKSSTASSATPKSSAPTIRQGVLGEDDELYREYRSNQRRSKKRS